MGMHFNPFASGRLNALAMDNPSAYLPGSPLAAYGMRRLVRGYAGPAVRVQRSSDSAQIDIGFAAASDELDYGTLDAFAAPSPNITMSVVTLYDQTGNGFHATAPASSAPAISPYTVGMIGSSRSARGAFDAQARGWTFPSGLSLNSQTASAFIACRPQSDMFPGMFYQVGAANLNFALWNDGGGNGQPSNSNFGTKYTAGSSTSRLIAASIRTDPTVMGVVASPSQALLYKDGAVLSTGAAATSVALTGGMIFNTPNFTNYQAYADFHGFVIYGSTLSPADVATVNTALSQTFPARGNVNLVFSGDSITFGSQTTYGQSVAQQISPLLKSPCDTYNTGVPSQFASNIDAYFAGREALLYNSTRRKNILHLWAGTNDIANNSATDAQVWASLQSIAAKEKALGGLVVMGTTIPRGSTAVQATISALNARERAAVGTGVFDAIADYAGDSIMGNAANLSNTTYYADGIHPTNAGAARLAAIGAGAVNSLL